MPDDISDVKSSYTRKVILADSSEWTGSAGMSPDEDYLWVWLDAIYSIMDVISAFSDPEKTTVIRSEIAHNVDPFSQSKTFSGYTRLVDVNIRNTQIAIGLKKA